MCEMFYSQEEILKKGLNFAPVPTTFLLQDTIAGMEEVARKLPEDAYLRDS